MAQPAPPDASGGHALVTLDGRYHIVERIASGGMGEVYLARDAVLDRQVAIKVLHRSLSGDPAFIDRFRREARAAAGLSHPNIVAIYDWGSVDGIYYMVMEYVRGQASRSLLNRDGKLELAQAVDVVTQILRGLDHAHRQGIVHRDIKPENVLVTTEGVVKVADFGLARAYADGRQTQAGTITGTVQYLAPEQIRGEPADPRSDLYSLGIVTYELLTGKLPFTGETAMSIAYKHLSGRVPVPSATVPSIPVDLDGFVASATDRDRELRPESAAAMRSDIEAIAPSLPLARALSALVDDQPIIDGGEGNGPSVVPTGVVSVPDAEPSGAATTTMTIPRAERTKRHRWRRRAGWLLLLMASVAALWGVWTYLVPHRADVPSLAGTGVAEAQAKLSDAGFTVRIGQGRYDERVAVDHVVKVQPVAGTTLERGSAVTLIPSLGPPPVQVPSIEGKTLDEARRRLAGAGFTVGSQRQRFSDTVPEGSIIDAPRGLRPKGSRIDVVVSKGPPPADIPRVAGETEAAATSALQDLGFVVAIETAFSNEVDRGSVMSLDPKAGNTRPYGSTVTLTVSQGPERFPVPSFTGLGRSAAGSRAAENGLDVSWFVVPGSSGALVIGQNPRAGTTVSYGDTIVLYLA